MKSAPDPKGTKRGHQRIKGGPHDTPLYTVSSIASFWCGIEDDDDVFDLGDIQNLLGDPSTKIHFKVLKGSRRVELDISQYPDSLPVAIGCALMAAVETLTRLMNAESLMIDQMHLEMELEHIFIRRLAPCSAGSPTQF